MKKILGGLALAICATHIPAGAGTIYLTRHAEKAATGTDPALTAEGQVRATNIAATLKDAQVRHIYSTAYQRTRQTAQPLASYLNLPVTTYDPGQLATFAQQLRALPDNALVVGHSDTTPDLIRQLGGDPGSAIAETEFDRLYQLTFAADGTVTTNLLHSMPSTLVLPCAGATLNQSSLTAISGSWLYFTVNVPECANTLNVNMSGGSGDGDLYVRFGQQPTANDYACRPYKNGNTESCALSNPQAGTWHIGIRSYTTFSGVSLSAAAVQ
ncbi:pre-peptidase C-terminal domain-containing protein [Pseudoduganella sp. HUAS MS19]